MRLFVVLALVAFTGGQASVLRSDEPKPQLELVQDAFWEYFVKATKSAQDSLQTFGESELGQEVITKIKDSVAVPRQYAKTAQDQVSIIAKEYDEKVSEQVEWLSGHLQQDINQVRAQLAPYTEEMRADIKPLVQKLRQVVDPHTESQDIKGLEDTLRQRVRELRRIVEKCVKDLDSQLAPSTKELQKKVAQRILEIERSVEHLPGTFQDEIRLSVSIIDYMFHIMVNVMLEVDPYYQDVKSELTALWESESA